MTLKLLPPLALLVLLPGHRVFAAVPEQLPPLIEQSCIDCHDKENAKGSLDLTSLSFNLKDRSTRERWIRIHDRVESREMPPKAVVLPDAQRVELLKSLGASLHNADLADVRAQGRGPVRRLNRDEYEQNLRDVLHLPNLDVRDMLREDREGHHFNKTSDMLDMSHVQLAAYLDAAEAALREAMVTGDGPPPVTKFRAVGASLFPEGETYGGREAMFFARG